MKNFKNTLGIIALVILVPLAVLAGFGGWNGTNNLGVFTNFVCSTGLTCTKVGNNFTVVSSPAMSGTTLTLSGLATLSGGIKDGTAPSASATAAQVILGATPVGGSSAGTYVFMNSASGYTGDFLNFQVNGGSSVFDVNYQGNLTIAGAASLGGTTNSVGNFSVATNKLTVAAASGNTAVAGTLGITGASTLTGGLTTNSTDTSFIPFPVTATTGIGTSQTPSATSVYVVGIYIPYNVTLTGLAINNAATCGTNSYVLALFNSSGSPVANTLLAGTTCSGTSAWQKIAFTSTYAAVGPGYYWIGVYMNGTTDRFFTIPQAGEYVGPAAIITAQTFGTVASITPPTTFSANSGPIVHTY
jgi:hypothetical protein